MANTLPDDPILPKGVTLREFDDTKAARKAIYDGTLDALRKRFPLENKSYRLELSNIRYTGPQDFTLAQQKQALLTDAIEGCYMSGNGDQSANSIGIAYDAIVSPVSEAVVNASVASVLFVICWDAV